jgi:hypothetical protein
MSLAPSKALAVGAATAAETRILALSDIRPSAKRLLAAGPCYSIRELPAAETLLVMISTTGCFIRSRDHATNSIRGAV